MGLTRKTNPLQKLHRQVLQQAFEQVELACAVLVKPDGTRQVVHFAPEYGDADGSEYMDRFIKDATPELKRGEKLFRHNVAIPVKILLGRGFAKET